MTLQDHRRHHPERAGHRARCSTASCRSPRASSSHLIGMHAEALPVAIHLGHRLSRRRVHSGHRRDQPQARGRARGALHEASRRSRPVVRMAQPRELFGRQRAWRHAPARAPPIWSSPPRRHPDDSAPSADLDALLYDAGRPVLLVPLAGLDRRPFPQGAGRLERHARGGARRLRRAALHHGGRRDRACVTVDRGRRSRAEPAAGSPPRWPATARTSRSAN